MRKLISLLAVSSLGLAACSGTSPNAESTETEPTQATAEATVEATPYDDESDSTNEPTGEALSVVTGLYPIQWMTERIGGDYVEVEDLLPPGGDAHHVELSPAQVAAANDSDLLIYISTLAPAIDEIAEQRSGETLDAASVIELREGGHDHAHEHGEEVEEHEHEHEHAEEAEEAEEHDHAHEHAEEAVEVEEHDHAHEHAEEAEEVEEHDHAHDHGGKDPHFWQDPELMGTLAQSISDKLAELDSAHAEEFQKNSSEVIAELTENDKKWASQLASCKVDTFITAHTAFAYLAERYDLDEEGIKGILPEAEPSPKRLQEVSEEIKEEGITTIFIEPSSDPAAIEALAGDLGITTDTLDPLASLSPNAAGDDYISVMQANIDALAKANDCK